MNNLFLIGLLSIVYCMFFQNIITYLPWLFLLGFWLNKAIQSKYNKLFIVGSLFVGFAVGLYYFPSSEIWYISMLFDIGKVLASSVVFALVLAIYKLFTDDLFWIDTIDRYAILNKHPDRFNLLKKFINFNTGRGNINEELYRLIKIVYSSTEKIEGYKHCMTLYEYHKEKNTYDSYFEIFFDNELKQIKYYNRLVLYVNLIFDINEDVAGVDNVYKKCIAECFPFLEEDKIEIQNNYSKAYTMRWLHTIDDSDFLYTQCYISLGEYFRSNIKPSIFLYYNEIEQPLLENKLRKDNVLLKILLMPSTNKFCISEDYLYSDADVLGKKELFSDLLENGILYYNGKTKLDSVEETKIFLKCLKDNINQ